VPEIDAKAGEQKPEDVRGVLAPGTRLRTYAIVSILGQGGFGITYLARDTQLARDVAIKEYLPISLALREDGTLVVPRSTEHAEQFVWGRERFLDEARTLAKLEDTPGIVRVHDFLEANGTAYMVMALARGETLNRRLMSDGPLPAQAITQLLYPLLDGLEEVHAIGFLHRDIKPANIIIDSRGNPTLIDFGASRAAMAGRTTAMTAIFTPGYAAAEQFTSARQGPWTDIYGLSATLYHAIAGKPPPNAVDRMLHDDYEPLLQLAPAGFAPSLLAGIDAGLRVRAAERPQSIADWRAVFEQTSSSDATAVMPRQARAAKPLQPLSTKRRRPVLWASIAAAVAVMVATGGYFGRSIFVGTAVQSLTAEQLTRALEERRKADALAAEKKKLEEEAERQATIDAEAKHKADEDLAAAQQQRQKAEEELATLKADMEARRTAAEDARQKAAAEAQRVLDEAAQKNKAEAEIAALRKADEEARQKAAADAAAKQAVDEEAQRKAEADAAASRAAEEAAQKKAAAEAEAKRQADETLAKAQAERQKADEEAAKQQAELAARQKAEADVEAKAQADAKAKADAEAAEKKAAEAAEKKAAEAAENGLHLAQIDRQRLQIALSSLGFNTNGSDGVFGARTRDTISAWQKARNLPATGFLNAAQQQALLKEGAAAVTKFDDDQKKIEEDKKKAEEAAKKKAEEEAKAKATQTAPAAITAPAQPQPATPHNGQWFGGIICSGERTTVQGTLSAGSGTLSGGAVVIRVQIAGDGATLVVTPSNDAQPGKSRAVPSGQLTGKLSGRSIFAKGALGGEPCTISLVGP
jgi:serine/threonine protein kinase